ncbi:hypothetical protein EBBID32_5830 [Sphingobium indicum BiD32]|uniref:Uncharacterized protein n=1 Tax=Sphingobium indicum BiD32 TaxID=1301087 RepID=N1MH33_9SPHN|nr:hypothetical protein EBBID32_5830 [Sphingobium indicum BiD32]
MPDREAGHGFFDEEGGDPLGAFSRAGIDDQRVGFRRVGDPEFGAVQNIAVALFVGAQLHGHDVRPGARFGHGERTDMLTGDEFGKVARLLLCIAPAADLIDAEVGVGTIAETYGGGYAGDLLLRDDMLQIAKTQAAVSLIDRDAVKAERAHFGPEGAGEPVLRIDPGRQRGDTVISEAARGVADHVRSFAQGKIEIGHRHLSITPILAAGMPREKLKGRAQLYSLHL